jgi:hypothetical protein
MRSLPERCNRYAATVIGGNQAWRTGGPRVSTSMASRSIQITGGINADNGQVEHPAASRAGGAGIKKHHRQIDGAAAAESR